jgi:hypothetical protein
VIVFLLGLRGTYELAGSLAFAAQGSRTPNASTLWQKTRRANGGCVRARYLLQALYPRATQVAAPTTPSLCKASNAQLNIGSAGI